VSLLHAPFLAVARPRWIVYALASEGAAIGVTVASLVLAGGHDLKWFVVLLVLGLAQAEMSRQIELRVRRSAGLMHITVTSVWFLAGAVLLSPGLAALLSATLYLHLWLRVGRSVSTRPTHRVIASTSWSVLSTWAAAVAVGVIDPSGFAARVLVGALAFELANLLLVGVGIFLYTKERQLTDIVGTWEDNALELVTLCLGGLTAVALVYQPVLVLLVFPPLLLVHPHALLKKLEVAAATDEKTGLLNNNGWHEIAHRSLDRARRTSGTLAIFMVDIDHFKRVNDTHGHLTGDTVLKAVAATITRNVRDYDAVGRFGGEEFVVLLPDIAGQDIDEIAERVRHAVTELTVPTDDRTMIRDLSVSVGTACYPLSGTTLDGLVQTADKALLHAKRNGRNRVTHAHLSFAQ
jgi:diguanylate cyclase (GGDEF)-like protein